MKSLPEKLRTERPAPWEQLPDLGLYMDQVLSYMPRQFLSDREEFTLTASMINNYSKSSLLPRSSKKKYGREHLAYLTALTLLKQVLSVNDTSKLLHLETQEGTFSFYQRYTALLSEVFSQAADQMEEIKALPDKKDALLRLVLSSYAQKLLCETLLKEMEENSSSL